MLRVLAVDPDYANGNLERVQKLVEQYLKCQEVYRGHLGTEIQWFGTEIEVLSKDEKGSLRVWSPVGMQDRLRDLINYDNLGNTKTPPDLAKLLFSGDEIDLPLGGGFRGHPSIGAAAFGLTFLHKTREPWSLLLEKMSGEMDQPTGSRVFLAGSIFGGTGASAIHPLARFLREQFEKNKDRLKIGVSALVPYFRFSTEEARSGKGGAGVSAGPMARSDNFSIATRAALEFYDYLLANDDWPFDSLSVVGDSGMMDVGFSAFGASQRNDAHFVELIASLCAIEFFLNPPDAKDRKRVRYSGPRPNIQLRDKGINLLDWPDLPLSFFKLDDLRDGLLTFWVAGTAHLGFYDAVARHNELDLKPECVPWYFDRFVKKGATLKTAETERHLDLITAYFEEHFFPWWRQVTGARSADVRLFNVESIEDSGRRGHAAGASAPRIDDLANLDWPNENQKRTLDVIDRYFSDSVEIQTDQGGSAGAASYLSILGLAARRFVAREYKRVSESRAEG
jgi:hypothetical protein